MKILHLLHEELNDEKADAFTSGFGDGYKKGFADAEELTKQRMEFQAKFNPQSEKTKLDLLINPDHILDAKKTTDGLVLYLNGRQLEPEEIGRLKGEMDLLRPTLLWSIMSETVKQKAIVKAVLDSKEWEETLAGKMMLHVVGLQLSILDLIEKAIIPTKK